MVAGQAPTPLDWNIAFEKEEKEEEEEGKHKKRKNVTQIFAVTAVLNMNTVLLRGTIVHRTYGIHKNPYIYPFLLTTFGPINYGQ